jgi:hypothetical protein
MADPALGRLRLQAAQHGPQSLDHRRERHALLAQLDAAPDKHTRALGLAAPGELLHHAGLADPASPPTTTTAGPAAERSLAASSWPSSTVRPTKVEQEKRVAMPPVWRSRMTTRTSQLAVIRPEVVDLDRGVVLGSDGDAGHGSRLPLRRAGYGARR